MAAFNKWWSFGRLCHWRRLVLCASLTEQKFQNKVESGLNAKLNSLISFGNTVSNVNRLLVHTPLAIRPPKEPREWYNLPDIVYARQVHQQSIKAHTKSSMR